MLSVNTSIKWLILKYIVGCAETKLTKPKTARAPILLEQTAHHGY